MTVHVQLWTLVPIAWMALMVWAFAIGGWTREDWQPFLVGSAAVWLSHWAVRVL